jgi:hypothetical protein
MLQVAYGEAMTVLSERDVRSALDLVYDAASMTGPDPFPRELLERLARLIPADAIVGYHEAIIGRPCRAVGRWRFRRKESQPTCRRPAGGFSIKIRSGTVPDAAKCEL